ncbi:polynucleotide 5 -hydroxyl-kinase [Cyclospora cayetanensis]|uniref:Polynucleotide 5-hydroxyl-kinase n=1 Tax=Cyclospora cayetanensis TaxID=88456 RepID=A0A1D3D666_9EIME|nr:polynucleotide 5 -hydroxyl-kinase [Cyclospora cayetanensis]
MRELRVLLPEPPEQEQGEGVFDERHTVAVKRKPASSNSWSNKSSPVLVSSAGEVCAIATALFGIARGALEYEAGDRAMSFICNLAAALNERRRAAAAQQTVGPRVLVTGSGGSGKSSVCQILCNYALREGWTPAFVELDARQVRRGDGRRHAAGSCDKGPLQLPPGCIGSCVCRYLDVEEPEDPLIFFVGSSVAAGGGAFCPLPRPPDVHLPDAGGEENAAANTAAANTAAANAAAATHAGAAAAGGAAGTGGAAEGAADGAGAAPEGVIGPGDISLELFPWLCSCLSAALHAAFAHSLLQHSEAAATGDPAELDDTAACNETHAPSLAASGLIANAPQQASLQQLQQLVELFGFDVVVVLDHPSLCHDLAGIYDHPDAARIRVLRRLWLRRYFFGASPQSMPPQTLRLPLSQCKLLQLRQKAALPLSALPADSQAAETSRLQWEPFRGLPSSLLNSLLAVPATRDLRGLPWTSVAFFAHVCSVEVDGDEPVLHLRVPGGMGDALGARLLLVPHDLRSMKCFLDG